MTGVGAAIRELLPLAVGIALSPIPVTAVILMLLSERAGTTGPAFLTGWVVGVAGVTTVVLLLVGESGEAGNAAGSEPSRVSEVLKVIFGSIMLVIAAWQWRSRPRHGKPAEVPKWMNAIDSLTVARALGLGVVTSGFNPKNFLMCLAAADTIAPAHLPAVQIVLAMAVFTGIASCTIAAPVIGYLTAGQKMAEPLNRLRAWLTRNNAMVVAAVLLVIGLALAGSGISALSR